ncbi:hypothetical protein [Flavobacterium psychrotolerans]|uniref:DUF4199 domain-containing protein n=1 Tax=Flavobacterium psychrotolerans TaxID=2169410 RepID=A0A2U1JJL0_9FLAO|nr:hypothetical protein [Flavobacterium psychrotolerans]PWA05179.1 hypothetical protein DB895_07680 [Flavobacterium psychrotolerans]
MKLPKELLNGFLIFLGIGFYFLLMNVLGFSNLSYLRLFNVVFIFYGVNRTLKMNLSEGKMDFASNAMAAMTTSIFGVVFSLLALFIYSHIKGGDAYVQSLSEIFLFGGNPSVNTYCIGLLFEGIASSVIVTLLLMLYFNNRFEAD